MKSVIPKTSDDLAKYIVRRKRYDKEFATQFEAGYVKFKLEVLRAESESGVKPPHSKRFRHIRHGGESR